MTRFNTLLLAGALACVAPFAAGIETAIAAE